MQFDRRLFASRLASAMIAAGIRQADLAAATGIAQSSISAYLRGKQCPSLEHAVAIAKTLSVPLTWLAALNERDEALTPQEHMLITLWRELRPEQRETILRFLLQLLGRPVKDIGDHT